jgi:hypothetical protein
MNINTNPRITTLSQVVTIPSVIASIIVGTRTWRKRRRLNKQVGLRSGVWWVLMGGCFFSSVGIYRTYVEKEEPHGRTHTPTSILGNPYTTPNDAQDPRRTRTLADFFDKLVRAWVWGLEFDG